MAAYGVWHGASSSAYQQLTATLSASAYGMAKPNVAYVAAKQQLSVIAKAAIAKACAVFAGGLPCYRVASRRSSAAQRRSGISGKSVTHGGGAA